MKCCMGIAKETKLSELTGKYPCLKEELSKVNKKFRLLNFNFKCPTTGQTVKLSEKEYRILEYMMANTGMKEAILCWRENRD